MKHFYNVNIQKVLLLSLVSILLFNFSVQTDDIFEKTKAKFIKSLNQKHLSNYLRQMMMKKNEITDNDFVFIKSDDFEVEPTELNFHSLQTDKKDANELKARLIAYKWGNDNIGRGKVKPYSVRSDSESTHQWKSYVVLLMGNGSNLLKKVCFPNSPSENIAVVIKHDKKCADKINKIYDYNIMEEPKKEESENTNNLQKVKKHKKKLHHKKAAKKLDQKLENMLAKPGKNNKRVAPAVPVKQVENVLQKKQLEKVAPVNPGVKLETQIPAPTLSKPEVKVQTSGTAPSPVAKSFMKKESPATNLRVEKKISTPLPTNPIPAAKPTTPVPSPSPTQVKPSPADHQNEDDNLRDLETKIVNLDHAISKADSDMNLHSSSDKNNNSANNDLEDLRMHN